MLKVDTDRGAALYVGINVEKGYESKAVALRHAHGTKVPVDQLLLTKGWDWHRALNLLPKVGPAIQDATRALGVHLYCWVEFGGGDDSNHFLVTPHALYERSGFRPVPWETVVQFAGKPRIRHWGRLAVMRAFSLDECTPELHESSVLEVFRALRNVRDQWRGIRSGASEPPKQRAHATSVRKL